MIIFSGIAARIALKLMSSRFALGPKVANLIGHAIVAAVMAGLLYAAYCWAWDQGRDAERAKWEAAAEILEDADAIADAEALDVATETKKDIDDANERAAAAASGSSDPLRDAFGSLRGEGSGQGDKAAR